MAVKIPSAEELKTLTPTERIKILKQLEEQRKKELEEEKKKAEAEIAAAEELIKETEDESQEDGVRENDKDRLKDAQRRAEEQSLEERVGKERPAQPPTEERQYGTAPSNLYKTLENDISELDRLYGKRTWDDKDKESYMQAKEHLDTVQQYKIGSERLAEELGLAMGNMNRLKYR